MSELPLSKAEAKRRMVKVLWEWKCYRADHFGGAEKRCSRCQKWFPFLQADGKPLAPNAFGTDRQMPFGNTSRCRPCLREVRQASAKRGKEG